MWICTKSNWPSFLGFCQVASGNLTLDLGLHPGEIHSLRQELEAAQVLSINPTILKRQSHEIFIVYTWYTVEQKVIRGYDNI